MRYAPAISGLLSVLLAGGLRAQASPRDTLCFAAFRAVQPRFANFERSPFSPDTARRDACIRVAAAAQAALIEARRSTFNTDREENQRRQLEAIQTTRDQTAGVAGEGAGTIEPVETAGGSVGAVGSEGGSSAVAALALNPSVFFVSPGDVEKVAKWSRFTDVSLLVPVSEADEDEDGDVDYVGVRWRINIAGLGAGDSLLAAVHASFERIRAQGSEEVVAIDSLLRSIPAANLTACLESLLRAGQVGRSQDELAASFEAAADACGRPAFLMEDSRALYTQLDEDIQRARAAADSRYFGLDLRGDFGDLERFGVDSLAGRSLTISIGFGRRFPFLGSDASNGLRANLGARYFDPNGTTEARFAATGGVAYEAVRYYAHQRLSLATGLEFEVGANGDDDAGRRNFMALRTSLNVPLAGTTSVTVNFGAPVVGASHLGPMLSVKANWRLLWTR